VLVDESIRHFDTVYRLWTSAFVQRTSLGVGVQRQLDAVVADLERTGLWSKSDGALCVFPRAS